MDLLGDDRSEKGSSKIGAGLKVARIFGGFAVDDARMGGGDGVAGGVLAAASRRVACIGGGEFFEIDDVVDDGLHGIGARAARSWR